MKIKIIVLGLIIVTLSITLVLPVLAASSDYLPQATEFYNRYCTRSNVPDTVAISCYLFDKVHEIQDQIGNLKEKVSTLEENDASQSAKLAELEERINVLEGSSTNCLEPPLGLLSWWPGDGNANDISDGNLGFLQNGTAFSPGKVDQAFSFDGLDDYVQAGTIEFPTGNNDRTIDLWVKINSFLADVPEPHSPLEAFFAGYGNFGSSNEIYALGTAGNVLYFSQWGSAIFGPSLQTDRWYHVAVTNTGNFATLYLDGANVASGNLNINTPSSTNFYIGKIPDPEGAIRRLDGMVDEIEVFNRALTQAEIQAIFEAGSAGKCKPTFLLNDNFDESSLNADIWEFFSTNGGNYAFDNGSIVVQGGTSMFYIRSKNNPFPTSGPFSVEFGIQYTVVDESGVGVALGFEQQEGYDQSNIPVSYWQDHNGLVVSRFGLTVASLSGGTDTNYHIGKITYDVEKYMFYLDGVLKYTSPPSETSKTVWFGNPFCCRSNWTGFKLDYIKVTQL